MSAAAPYRRLSVTLPAASLPPPKEAHPSRRREMARRSADSLYVEDCRLVQQATVEIEHMAAQISRSLPHSEDEKDFMQLRSRIDEAVLQCQQAQQTLMPRIRGHVRAAQNTTETTNRQMMCRKLGDGLSSAALELEELIKKFLSREATVLRAADDEKTRLLSSQVVDGSGVLDSGLRAPSRGSSNSSGRSNGRGEAPGGAVEQLDEEEAFLNFCCGTAPAPPPPKRPKPAKQPASRVAATSSAAPHPAQPAASVPPAPPVPRPVLAASSIQPPSVSSMAAGATTELLEESRPPTTGDPSSLEMMEEGLRQERGERLKSLQNDMRSLQQIYRDLNSQAEEQTGSVESIEQHLMMACENSSQAVRELSVLHSWGQLAAKRKLWCWSGSLSIIGIWLLLTYGIGIS